MPTPTYVTRYEEEVMGYVVDINCLIQDSYTEDAFNILLFASKESHRMRYNFVTTEFILLALVSEGTDLAAKVLNFFGVTPYAIKLKLKR